jgi:transcriptional regulator with PAS, ATPase and Fis domain
VIEIAPAVYRRLKEYHWPGNMRELQNVITRALINLDRTENVIEERHLVMPFSAPQTIFDDGSEANDGTLKDLHRNWEKNLLVKALHEAAGNKAETARRLDISIRNLYNKLHQHKLL